MTQSKKIIAVTGGIGSGKSTACNILKEMGYPVFSCDEVYSELLEDKIFLNKIEERLGKVTGSDGKLDRKALSAKVFADSNARKVLESISHPAIMEELLKRANSSQGSLAFCEVPLLFENGFEKLFDGVIVLMRPLEDRVAAVEERSALTREEVLVRISAQYDYSEIVQNDSCKIVYNNGNMSDLRSTMCDIITYFKPKN